MTSETDIREATATVRGYLYQFDATICSIVQLNEQDTLTIEGIEDYDVGRINLSELFQCKYYSSQRLTNATIRDAILPMIRGFVSLDAAARAQRRFHLYGYFKDSSPGEKTLTSGELKQILVRRQRAGSSSESREMEMIDVQSELRASDDDVAAFAGLLTIHICEEYDAHRLKTVHALRKHFGVTQLEAEAFLYPSALTFVSSLAANPDRVARQISKANFTKEVNPSRSLYNAWTLREKGATGYCAGLRRTQFSAQNVDAMHRFFVVEALEDSSDNELLTLCHVLRKKWSSHGVRRKPDSERYLPFIYFKGLPPERLVKIKSSLQRDGVSFVDGYPFLGADFNIEQLCSHQTFQNQISLRILHSDEALRQSIASVKGRRCVYEFFFEKPILSVQLCSHVSMPVTSISMISNIV
ncbi:MAG: DUF4297 family anti-phage-associated protein [Bacteroidota bacterium]|jgi:hypothetical protein